MRWTVTDCRGVLSTVWTNVERFITYWRCQVQLFLLWLVNCSVDSKFTTSSDLNRTSVFLYKECLCYLLRFLPMIVKGHWVLLPSVRARTESHRKLKNSHDLRNWDWCCHFEVMWSNRAGGRHVRSVLPNRAADFRGRQFWHPLFSVTYLFSTSNEWWWRHCCKTFLYKTASVHSDLCITPNVSTI